MENHELEKQNRMDVTRIQKENLVDIRTVKLNNLASIDERIESFLDQIKNPYCFLYDSTPVQISFSDENHTLQGRLKRYFLSRKRA